MGQKTNPNIFRLGISKTWKTKFYEKKTGELADFIFNDLEIINYIKRFFQTNDLYLHDYKLSYSNSTINIFISYFITEKFSFTHLENKLQIRSDNSGKGSKIVKLVGTREKIKRGSNSRLINSSSGYINRLSRLFVYNSLTLKRRGEYSVERSSTNVLAKLVEGLNLFTGNKHQFILTMKCINTNFVLTKYQSKTLKKKLLNLQRFRNSSFFKEGFNVFFVTLSNGSGASLLATFIAAELKRSKRQKPIFMFIKRFFNLFINTNMSSLKGVKVIVKGKLNGAPRAKHKIITVGSVPIQTISEIIDYSSISVQNPNGSYGIKVWVVEK